MELCEEFSNVLVEELTQAQNIQYPPMDVEQAFRVARWLAWVAKM